MRLLNVETLELKPFESEKPPYAVASHRWKTGAETSYSKFRDNQDQDTDGHRKVLNFAGYVRDHIPDIEWLWIDTCCVDQDSPSEQSEAITSMFRWYSESAICLAWLADVPDTSAERHFQNSNWFSRGWTLQELLAPQVVVFLNVHWHVVGHKGKFEDSWRTQTLNIGDSLDEVIAKRTKIPKNILIDFNESSGYKVESKMEWNNGRATTKPEDKWYCLCGIFGVALQALYGEGAKEAERRLWYQIHDRAPTLAERLQGEILEAARKNNFEYLQGELKHNTKIVNAVDAQQMTLLHYFVRAENYHATEELVSRRARINAMDAWNKTPLHYAARNPLLRWILNNGSLKNHNGEGHTALSWAASVGDLKTMHSLLGQGLEVDVLNLRDRSALMEACAHGQTKAVALLLDCGANSEPRNEVERSVLPTAASSGCRTVCKLLLERHPHDFNWGDQKEMMLLSSCKRNDVSLVQLLLAQGANPNGPGGRIIPPLCIALNNKFQTLVPVILKRNSNLELCDFGTGRTALAEACRSGQTHVVELLLEHGAEVNARNTISGRTPLMEAAESGHYDIVCILIGDRWNADVNACDTDDRTALWYAILEKREAVVSALLQKDVRPSLERRGIRSRVGEQVLRYTPLCLACSHYAPASVVYALLAKGVDVNAQNSNGWTALAEASRHDQYHIAAALLRSGADVDRCTVLKRTPLHQAAERGHTSIVELLIDEGKADIDAKDFELITPLMRALWERRHDAARALIERGANVNVYGGDHSYHPLNVAAMKGSLDIVFLLLDTEGVNVDVQNADGWTALAEASHHGHLHVVQALIDRGANIELKNIVDRRPIDVAQSGRQDIRDLLDSGSLIK